MSAWQIPAFRHFVVARAVAMAGNALTVVALPVLVYRLTGSATMTAAVAVVETLPYVLVGLPVGALVDRWRARRVVVAAQACSAVALLSVAAADLFGVLGVGHVFAAAVVVATAFVFADAASFGIVPQMVGRARVASGTSLLVSIGTVIALGGPLVAGVLVTTASPAVVLGLDGLGYLFAAGVLARLRWPGSEELPGAGTERRLRREIGEGLRFIWETLPVRWLTVFGAGASLSGGAVSGLLVVLGVEQLGLDAASSRLGWLFAAGAAGAVLGSLLLPRVQRRVGVGLITTVGYAVALAGVLTLSSVTTLGGALPVLVLVQAAMTMLVVNGIVTRQVLTPGHLQARVNTTARLIAWGGTPAGAALGGVVAGFVGTPWALRVAALGLLVSLVGAVLVGVWRFGRLDELESD